MSKQNIIKKIANFLNLKELGKRALTVIILTLTAIITVWVYAAFVEPAVGPSSSDQDFAQNILGANDADNEFDSSNVAANTDGSIIERLEYVQGQGSTTPTCGNGVLEAGEGCDDGGTSWTSGTCAGDCSRRNYWSEPLVGTLHVNNGGVGVWCQMRGFSGMTSVIQTDSTSLSTAAGGDPGTVKTFYNYGMMPIVYTIYTAITTGSADYGTYSMSSTRRDTLMGHHNDTGQVYIREVISVYAGCPAAKHTSWSSAFPSDIWCAD